ncbi:MAG TPA: alpha/beta fold hydrolase [Gemmatimonadales bacterium]|jgi:proline iminopeptidase|nr:alpha/beta fold hydrolase [Gemmatimonadales bacterium]
MAERTFERHVNGVTLFERRTGEGPPVVILHGGPGASHDYLLPGCDALATGRELVYYDQRGGGRSAVGREVPVGYREQVADLHALKELWGDRPLDLVGYSWGGLLAMLYTIAHPCSVARLALVSPAPAWREGRVEYERRYAAITNGPWAQAERQKLRASGLQGRDLAAYQRRIFELAVIAYFKDPEKVRELAGFRLVERTQKGIWESLGDYDLRPALRRLDLPAVVLHGKDDVIPWETAEETAECLKAEFHLIPDCGHVPYVEGRETFVRVLDAFLPREGRA